MCLLLGIGVENVKGYISRYLSGSGRLVTYKGQWILRVCSGNIKHCSNVKTVPSSVFFHSCVTLETKDFNRNLPRSGLIRQKTLMFPLSSWIVLCSTLLSVSYPRSFAWNQPRITRVTAGLNKLGFSNVFGVDPGQWPALGWFSP